MKGQFLPDSPGEGYNQVSSGGAAGGTLSGKFLPKNRSKEIDNESSGEGHPALKASKFCGPTKGNRDSNPNKSTGISSGHGGGQHKAGGKG